jgi:hypothetical protein
LKGIKPCKSIVLEDFKRLCDPSSVLSDIANLASKSVQFAAFTALDCWFEVIKPRGAEIYPNLSLLREFVTSPGRLR